MTDKTGGPAFPSHGTMGEVTHDGMTLRDYFAANAMNGLIFSGGWVTYGDCAKTAYKMADAMIAEKNKETGHGA